MRNPNNDATTDIRHAARYRPLATDSTDALREMHPDLAWAWDELDVLRADRDEKLEMAVSEFVARLETLVADHDMSDAVQTELEDLIEKLEELSE